STTTKTGNQIAGGYTITDSATDNYSMQESGSNPMGAYYETVTGTDVVTMTESGNSGNQTFTRTTSIAGSYTLIDVGDGATHDSGSGTYTIAPDENAHVIGGFFEQPKGNSIGRYAMLEFFNDCANAH